MNPLLKNIHQEKIDHSNKQNNYSLHRASKNFLKIYSSDATNHSSQVQYIKLRENGQKVLSLLDCRSSKSITNVIQDQSQIDLKLTAYFLQSSTEQQYINCLKQMWNNYENKQTENLSIFLQLQRQQNDFQGKMLSHYLGTWLYSMGYQKTSNKKYILSRIKMHQGIKQISKASVMYDNIFKNTQNLTEQERFKIIIDVCKNGWQIFINYLVEYLQNGMIQFKTKLHTNNNIYSTNLISVYDIMSKKTSFNSDKYSSNVIIQEFDQQERLVSFANLI